MINVAEFAIIRIGYIKKGTYMEILERDLENGIIRARLWARTKNPSGELNGHIDVLIADDADSKKKDG